MAGMRLVTELVIVFILAHGVFVSVLLRTSPVIQFLWFPAVFVAFLAFQIWRVLRSDGSSK
jgi:hypothetical protein